MIQCSSWNIRTQRVLFVFQNTSVWDSHAQTTPTAAVWSWHSIPSSRSQRRRVVQRWASLSTWQQDTQHTGPASSETWTDPLQWKQHVNKQILLSLTSEMTARQVTNLQKKFKFRRQNLIDCLKTDIIIIWITGTSHFHWLLAIKAHVQESFNISPPRAFHCFWPREGRVTLVCWISQASSWHTIFSRH